jgi:hypothetical protein
MRAMQYAYNRKFFVLLLLSIVAITLALASATVAGWVLLAFALVTSGVTASVFLHFSDFARTHARAIEMRINKLLGRRVLLASEIEADYFYPHESSKLSGFVPDRPDTFFSMFTLHFTFVWAAAIVTAWWNVLGEIGVWRALPALAVFTAWTALNVAFLLRWFSGDAERRIANTLRDAYDLEGEL